MVDRPLNQTCLVSPRLDFWILGGAYFATLLPVCWLFGSVTGTPASQRLATMLTYLSYAVNYPHFLMSYLLLYGDHGRKIFKSWRFAWAGIFSPLLIFALLWAAFRAPSGHVMGMLIGGMFVVSGWHYTKQTFGATVVTSLQRGAPLNRQQHRIAKINLLSVWVAGAIYARFAHLDTRIFYGLTAANFDPPRWVVGFFLSVVGVTTIALALVLISRRTSPGSRTGVSYAAGWAWMLPVWGNGVLRSIVPFFHCLQYFAFTFAFRKNKVIATLGHAPATREERRYFLVRTVGYLGMSFPLGALFFVWLPTWFDSHWHTRFPQLGPLPFLIAFTVFLNLHHFFIDSVIWKGSDPDVRANLLGARRDEAPAEAEVPRAA